VSWLTNPPYEKPHCEAMHARRGPRRGGDGRGLRNSGESGRGLPNAGVDGSAPPNAREDGSARANARRGSQQATECRGDRQRELVGADRARSGRRPRAVGVGDARGRLSRVGDARGRLSRGGRPAADSAGPATGRVPAQLQAVADRVVDVHREAGARAVDAGTLDGDARRLELRDGGGGLRGPGHA
jgi:hypothetical protein